MFQIGSEFVMRTLVTYGLALVASLLMLTAAQAQCYTDPFTGRQVCSPVRTVVATLVPNAWEVSPSPVRSAIAQAVPDSWEMPVARGYSVSSTVSYGSTGSVSYGSTGGYSVSGTTSGGSTGYSVSSTQVVQSYGSTGSAVQSYGSTGSVQSYGSAGSSACDLPVRTPVRNLIQALRPANQPVRKVLQSLRPVSYSPVVQDSTYGFAATLNASGGLFHDNSYNGAEVVYRSSGVATEEAARRSWMRSPGHRRLLLAGRVSEVVCVGNVCVGR